MDDRVMKLREQIAKQSPQASHQLLVEYLKLLGEKAKRTPPSELEVRGNYSADVTFPQTIGEDIASEISSCIAWQDWTNQDDSPDLEEIGALAAQLEMSTDNHRLWQELLNRIETL